MQRHRIQVYFSIFCKIKKLTNQRIRLFIGGVYKAQPLAHIKIDHKRVSCRMGLSLYSHLSLLALITLGMHFLEVRIPQLVFLKVSKGFKSFAHTPKMFVQLRGQHDILIQHTISMQPRPHVRASSLLHNLIELPIYNSLVFMLEPRLCLTAFSSYPSFKTLSPLQELISTSQLLQATYLLELHPLLIIACTIPACIDPQHGIKISLQHIKCMH